jgi:hypothetical protein
MSKAQRGRRIIVFGDAAATGVDGAGAREKQARNFGGAQMFGKREISERGGILYTGSIRTCERIGEAAHD